MSIRKINGFQFEQMVRNGFANLHAAEEELNRLNVFPVPDGDTGTNMCLTLANGLRSAESQGEIGRYLKGLSDGMMLGARGNSGVILSQLFKGLWIELARFTSIGPGELRNALVLSYRSAYRAVIQPVEGTILTVAREGIEHIRLQINRSTGIDTLLAMYTAEMRKTLSYTPEMLPALKEAGVVDSGALGYILIFEGMLKSLYGETLAPAALTEPAPEAAAGGTMDLSLFDENSSFVDGYCMEFILQLMRAEGYSRNFRLNAYIEDLKLYGTSLVVIQDGTRVKVHIHTHKPANVIRISQDFGEFVTFKLENMQLQHNEQLRRTEAPAPKRDFATVAVANGEGMETCFRELGCDYVIDGTGRMNPSSQAFLDAFNALGAERIAVLPNNGNAVLAADQAASLFHGGEVVVLPSRSMVEGYFALAMDVRDSADIPYRLRQMRSGIEGVQSISATRAVRPYAVGEITCREGDSIALMGSELVAAGGDMGACIVAAMRKVPDLGEKENCLLFRGAGAEEAGEQAVETAIREAFPLLEVDVVYGGQAVYDWLIGLT